MGFRRATRWVWWVVPFRRAESHRTDGVWPIVGGGVAGLRFGDGSSTARFRLADQSLRVRGDGRGGRGGLAQPHRGGGRSQRVGGAEDLSRPQPPVGAGYRLAPEGGRRAGRGHPGRSGRLPGRVGQGGRDHEQGQAACGRAALGGGPGRVVPGGRVRGDRPQPRLVEQALRLGAGRAVLRAARPGHYRVGLLNDPSAASPWFQVGPAAQLYARPLANALYFYQNERDGPDFIRTALGHLNDASAMTYRTPPVDDNGSFKGSLAKYATGVRINATGSWFDAGDYLHFVETTSYTEAMLLQGVAAFPRQMGAGSGADFTGEVKFGLDFLQHMWHQKTRTLYYEVGTGEANS